MSGSLATSLRLPCCFTALQLAEKHLEKAKYLISKRKREDVEAALVPLEAALELRPDWDGALELKARALLYLKRFKDVVDMFHEYVPSLQLSPRTSPTPSPAPTPHVRDLLPDSPCSYKEKTRLLSEYAVDRDEVLLLLPFKHCFPVSKLKIKLSTSRLSVKKAERQQQWRYLVLGQACCHLGMLEDAMALLQKGKKSASDMSRHESNCLREDNFCGEGGVCSRSVSSAESELVTQMLTNIKFLLRRQTAAMAALEAGLYAESVRHFSKIIDGHKGTPQGFVADCYLYRAIAYQAMGRVVDAISDCNRSLTLSPYCSIQALSVRASLYEMVRCYSECLLDLQQLKLIYEASLRYQSRVPELSNAIQLSAAWTLRQPHVSQIDFAGGLEYINSKITAARQRLSSACSLDAYTILDMPRNCTLEDVERAYLLISLKHRADKAAQFVERRDFVGLYDHRNAATIKEEARASALRLSQLIHKAYTKLISSIAQQETENRNELMASEEFDNGKSCAGFSQLESEQGGEGEEGTCSIRGKVSESERERVMDNRKTQGAIGFLEFSTKDPMGHTVDKAHNEGEGDVFLEGILSDEDERDGCDFCQPFGGFSSSALASAISQALSDDLPLSSSSWTPDWTFAKPLPVT